MTHRLLLRSLFAVRNTDITSRNSVLQFLTFKLKILISLTISGFDLEVFSNVLEKADRGVGGSAETLGLISHPLCSVQIKITAGFSLLLGVGGGGCAGQESRAND